MSCDNGLAIMQEVSLFFRDAVLNIWEGNLGLVLEYFHQKQDEAKMLKI